MEYMHGDDGRRTVLCGAREQGSKGAREQNWDNLRKRLFVFYESGIKIQTWCKRRGLDVRLKNTCFVTSKKKYIEL